MKNLVQYIKEEYKNYRLNEVVAKFGIKENDLVIEVPDNYLEDQIQLYLDDTIINKTFVGEDHSEDLFGKNSENIADAYFEYTGLEETSLTPIIKWDDHYKNGDTDTNDTKLKRMKLKDFKFVIQFDRFDILNGSDDTVKSSLDEIFKRCISDEFQWPLNFTFDPDDVEYRK